MTQQVRDRVDTPVLTIGVCPELHGERREKAWNLYQNAFADLDGLAIQRHLMTRDEFDHVAGDTRIDKYCAVNSDGDLVGLATYTNQLEAWPLISTAYFARRWPAEYAARHVWYCGFVAVDQQTGAGAYLKLVEALYRHAEKHQGVISLDVCRRNDVVHHISRSIGVLLHRLSDGRVRAECADTQSFWVYETGATTA